MLSTGLMPGIRAGLAFAVDQRGYRRDFSVPDDVRAMTSLIHAREGEMNGLREAIAVVVDGALAYPWALPKLILIKAARSWYGTDSGDREVTIGLFQVVYLGLAFYGAWRTWRLGLPHQQKLLLVVLGFVLSFWALTMLVFSIARYMVPAIGLLFLFLPAVLIVTRASAPTAQ